MQNKKATGRAAGTGELGRSANKDTHMASVGRNFVLFRTDLFVFRQRDEDIDAWSVGGDCAGWFYVRLLLMDHIEHWCDPVMEDWGGWTFAVAVDGVRVWVNVWPFFTIENCWLFGVEPKGRWFRRQTAEELTAAKEVVANALETIMAADARIVKRGWFADNPFELNIKDF